MPKRVLIVVVAAAVILATNLAGVAYPGGFPGDGYRHHRRNIPIDWRVSGTIAYVQLAPLPDPSMIVPGIMIQADLKGAPGKAHFTVISIGYPPEELGACGGGLGQNFAHNDMVVTFEDLSMLFAELVDGYLCFTGPDTVEAWANMTITDGTGNYEDAKGQFTGHFLGRMVGTSGALSAETGTIEGEIVWESSVPQ